MPGHYLLTFDNHNSVNGIREYARHKGAAFPYVPVVTPELRLDEAALVRLQPELDENYRAVCAAVYAWPGGAS